MVIMATHGRGGLQRLYLDSVADKVMRKASQPTLLVSPREEIPARQTVQLRRIAVPLDGSSLAEGALTSAGELAALAGAHLLLVRVQPLVVTATLAYPFVPGFGTIEAELEQQAQQYLEGVRRRLPAGLPVDIAVLRGAPSPTLTDYLRESAVDLVLMTTPGRGGFQRLVVGSTADWLVHFGFPYCS
jgi:nucleotide-binding universal stress UspA family protein